MVRMRLEPQDDYLHAVEAASNFNESRYYNFFDPGAGMGGWVRMGNRPNEGYAEMTVCLYLPDGRVAFNYKRPQIDGHDSPRRRRPALRGGRAVRRAPRHLRRQGVRARRARARWPIRRARSTTTRTRRAPSTSTSKAVGTAVGRRARVGGGRGEARPRSREDVRPRPHRAAHGDHRHGRGRRRDVRRSPTALGLRDHSWGPRFWQNIWWYRWLTVNLGPELGFALHDLRRRGRSRRAARRRLPVRRRPLRRRPLGADPRRAS